MNALIGLGLVVVFALLIGVFTFLATRKGAKPAPFRRVDAFYSLPNTVGQAVETGKRLHISLGAGAIGHSTTATTLAGLTVLDQISEGAVVSDKPPVITTADASAMLLAQDVLQAVYQHQNAAERYDPDSAHVVGVSPLTFGAAQTTLPKDEVVAGTVLIGPVGPEAVLLAEASRRANVTTLAGADDPAAQALLFATTDHPLVGEDTFAGGAYIGRAPAHVASLQAQDIIRVLIGVAMVLGAIYQTARPLLGLP
jgi:hypothetical protein